ncbi:hypothetical protein N9133_00815 [Akkermansiaceae bacterium]|nr:sorbosone dehydrogenase [bacterium]MDB4457895.1 hypothetical protein [Akkermansiaceae bacterium]
MKIGFIILLSGIGAQAQNGLRDIPDPDPAKQAAAFNLPEGMEINLFASDPMISKPVQMNWDSEGRLWVVSSGTYPHIVPGAEENDQLLVLEDTDGDGVADKRTVFADDLHIPTAVLPADGGVYVANSTEILFLKDTDGDLVADERRVVLSGFGTEDTHHLVHTFRQGPGGMLYFLQSIYIHSHLETPHGVRRLMGGGIWHYRPETGRAEVLSKGLVNPWGLVFDDYGQSFATDGAGGDGINFIFPRAVGVTSPGAKRVIRGLNPGQPKLCGLEILSGSHVPEEVRGVMIAPDFRGHRINAYRLSPKGSSYESTQLEDFLSSSHRAFRPIDVKMGPDGAVYIADWYNPIIQHGEVDFRDERRDHVHGRIWRVTFKDRGLVKKPKIKEAKTEELLELLKSEERPQRDFARQELRHRGGDVLSALRTWTKAQDDESVLLEALWTFQSLDVTEVGLIRKLVKSRDPRIRAAVLRVIYHRHEEIPEVDELIAKAVRDDSAQVRLWAVSCLAQRPSAESVPLALEVLNQPMDEALDFALWSIVREHEKEWVPLYESGRLTFNGNLKQLVFAMTALEKPLSLASVFEGLQSGLLKGENRSEAISAIGKVGTPSDLARLFEMAGTEEEVLDALIEAKRNRKMEPVQGKEKILGIIWEPHLETYQKAAVLAGLWKAEGAFEKLKEVFSNELNTINSRKAAAQGLRHFGGGKVIAFFEDSVLKNKNTAIRELAVSELAVLAPVRAAKGAVIVLQSSEGSASLGILIDIFLKNSGASTALAKALDGQSLPRAVAILGVQRAGTSGKPPQDLIKAFEKAGDLKPMAQQLKPKEMKAMVERVQNEGDPHRGERVYRRAALQCMACHAIGVSGGLVGPNLVSIGGSAPVDYLVNSMLIPSDKIKEGYHTTLVTTKDGNSFTGGLVSEGDQEITLRDSMGKMIKIPTVDVKSKFISPVSMMPPGLTASLREDEFVDLIRFLSELGKEGEFKVGPKPIIRNWQVLQPHERTRDLIGHLGEKIFAERFEGYSWSPMVSMVSGELPTDEMPQVLGRGRNRYGVARFGITSDGPVVLKINETRLMHLFDGEKEIELPENGPASIELAAGKAADRFTLVVNSAYRPEPILVEEQRKK